MSDKKRILIIDHDGDWGQKDMFPKDDVVKIVPDFSQGLAELQPVYDEVAAANSENVPKANSVIAWMSGFQEHRSEEMQKALLATCSVPWDAVITDACSKELNQPIGLALAFIASLANVPYVIVGINENLFLYKSQPGYG